jgi:protein quaking
MTVFFLVFPEIAKVRSSLFQINGAKKDPLVLPDAEGTPTTLTEKVYVPVKEHPDVSMHTSRCLPTVT